MRACNFLQIKGKVKGRNPSYCSGCICKQGRVKESEQNPKFQLFYFSCSFSRSFFFFFFFVLFYLARYYARARARRPSDPTCTAWAPRRSFSVRMPSRKSTSRDNCFRFRICSCSCSFGFVP